MPQGHQTTSRHPSTSESSPGAHASATVITKTVVRHTALVIKNRKLFSCKLGAIECPGDAASADAAFEGSRRVHALRHMEILARAAMLSIALIFGTNLVISEVFDAHVGIFAAA